MCNCHENGFFRERRPKGKTADKLLELVLSENPLEAAIGIATVNALSHMLQNLEPENFPFSSIDILDLIKPEDRVAMVGYFGPLVPKILKITDKLIVLEKREIEAPQTRTLSSEKVKEILPVSDIIVLSASTLANRTFDELLSLRGAVREVILLGPSAPLIPEPFFQRGITAVMGTRIFDPLNMLTIVSEAGGTKKVQRYCGKMLLSEIKMKTRISSLERNEVERNGQRTVAITSQLPENRRFSVIPRRNSGEAQFGK